MISFVRFDSHSGIWANRDKALEYMSQGLRIFTDASCETELTEEDLLAMDETIQHPEPITFTSHSTDG